MWVEVHEGKLYVDVEGVGAPIMFLHGWPLDHRMFAPQVAALRKHFTVITFDRRGFGKSEAPPNLQIELEDVDRILDTIEVREIHLLGMSQGGRIALRYAATRPGRVRSLLLQGAIIDGLDVEKRGDGHVPLLEYAELVRQGRFKEFVERWLRHPMMWLGDGHQDSDRLLRSILDSYSGADLINFTPDNYAFKEDVLAAMTEFPRPTLLLTGARETDTRRRHANELLRRMPNCREVVFVNSGHLSNLSEPARYNRAVIDFCSGVDAEDPF